MAKISPEFSRLLKLYNATSIEYPQLKAASVAQWIEESGWGRSELARVYNNFAGIKYRTELRDYARRVRVKVSDGTHYFAHFFDLESFIAGYWANLERAPYQGWRATATDPVAFIRFIGPIWAQNPYYVAKLLTLLPKAEKLIAPAAEKRFDAQTLEKFLGNARLRQILIGFLNDDRFLDALQGGRFAQALGRDFPPLAPLPPVAEEETAGCCDTDGHAPKDSSPDKPAARYIPSPNWSSRNGVRIDHIVIHYTVSSRIESAIAQFRKTHGRRRSAHYIVGRDGQLVQMVHDTRKAWHATSKNARSIGIEHVALPGQEIAPAQARTSLQLIRWLMAEYAIPKANIIPHKCVPQNTRCCGDLFAKYKDRGDPYSCQNQQAALQKWLSANGIT